MNRNPEITKLPPDPFYGSAEAAAYFGYSLSHFRALVRAGKLPQPVRIAGRKLALQLPSCIEVRALSGSLVSSTPE